ncbi:hypothetical protein ACFWPK_04305 [Nocardia sp. NPDC058519]|uniref:hypothetical protein n=1 Tax=Nocardia sp. NPDC058519 TaxID=3346535 RepID=UPI0036495D0B
MPTAPKTKKKPERVTADFVHNLGEGDDVVEVRLPSLTYLQTSTVRALRGLNDRNAMWFVIEKYATEEMIAAIDSTFPDQMDALLDAWAEHSGISLGES